MRKHYTSKDHLTYQGNITSLHIEEYAARNLPLTEKRRHMKLNYQLRESISSDKLNILPSLSEKSHTVNQLHLPNIRY